MKAWLSRQRNGDYMLTGARPRLHGIGNTNTLDFYVPVGDPLGFRHICPEGAKSIFGVDIPCLESVLVTIEGKHYAE